MTPKLYEKYRPKALADIVGQDKIVKRLERMRDQNSIGGQAFWISGQSGTGKTTIARILAAYVADVCIYEYDATELTPTAFDTIRRTLHMSGLGNPHGRAYIINEAHGLRKDIARRFLTLLEDVPAHAVLIFTTTNIGQRQLFEDSGDAGPLLSRCVRLALTQQGLCKPFARLVHDIAEREGLNGQPVSAYERLLKDHANNCRAALQAVQGCEML